MSSSDLIQGKPRILTGDTPTGSLHLGHWVGSVKRRVELQESHDCYFIIANMHAYTTRLAKSDEIRRDSIAVAVIATIASMPIAVTAATVPGCGSVPARRSSSTTRVTDTATIGMINHHPRNVLSVCTAQR